MNALVGQEVALQAQLRAGSAKVPFLLEVRDGAVRYSHDGTLMFGVVEWEEPEGGILHASAHAYAAMATFWRDSGYPYLLRIWNYFDAITLGHVVIGASAASLSCAAMASAGMTSE